MSTVSVKSEGEDLVDTLFFPVFGKKSSETGYVGWPGYLRALAEATSDEEAKRFEKYLQANRLEEYEQLVAERWGELLKPRFHEKVLELPQGFGLTFSPFADPRQRFSFTYPDRRMHEPGFHSAEAAADYVADLTQPNAPTF